MHRRLEWGRDDLREGLGVVWGGRGRKGEEAKHRMVISGGICGAGLVVGGEMFLMLGGTRRYLGGFGDDRGSWTL